MKRNGWLLIVESMLALLTMAGTMPTTFMDGFFAWVLCFCFWFVMLLPAWSLSPARRMTDAEVKAHVQRMIDNGEL